MIKGRRRHSDSRGNERWREREPFGVDPVAVVLVGDAVVVLSAAAFTADDEAPSPRSLYLPKGGGRENELPLILHHCVVYSRTRISTRSKKLGR